MDTNTVITILTLLSSVIIFFISFKVSIQKDMEYMKSEISTLKDSMKESTDGIHREIANLAKKQEKYNNMQMRILALEIKTGTSKK